MPLKKEHLNSESPNSIALLTMAAYHRAVNRNGTAVEMRDCLRVEDPAARARLLAEVCLRARFEGAVAHALNPTPANPRAVELHCYAEIRDALGHDVATHVAALVHGLMKNTSDELFNGPVADALSAPTDPTDESGSDGSR